MDYGLILTVLAITVIVVLGVIAIRFTVNLKIDWAERQKIKTKKCINLK